MNRVIQLHPADNVVVALENIGKGTQLLIEGQSVWVMSDIYFGHKLAIRPIKEGAQVLKYGSPIGRATKDIWAGEHVHTHNLQSDYSYGEEA